MNNYNFLIFSVFIFMNISCSSVKNVNGEYISIETGTSIILNKNKTFLIINKSSDVKPVFTCCDTITYGDWKSENKCLLIFNSPDFYNTGYVNSTVEESFFKSPDSLYINIDNPIEKHKKKYDEKNSYVDYYVEVSSNDKDYDVKLSQKKFSNNIKVLKPKSLVINSISIIATPTTELGLRNIGIRQTLTLPYQINDIDKNAFNFKIPSLTYSYLSLMRLKDYSMRLNNNVISWNGYEYIKR